MPRVLMAGIAIATALGCTAARPPAPLGFAFERDTFAFANETVWEYHVEGANGATRWTERDPAPPFSLRCGNMARAVRQFRLHARFAPDAPGTTPAAYAELVREVLARDPRARSRSPDPVVVPGHPDLRTLSAAHPGILQEALGGSWRSYLQRGNWRMIFPFTDGHQRATAARLEMAVAAGELPIVHVLRYPQLTVNHLLLVYAATPHAAGVRFVAYDPNNADRPLEIDWNAGSGQFEYPRTIYFSGGPVKLYEVYDGWLR